MRNQFGVPVPARANKLREVAEGIGMGLLAFGPVLLVVLMGGLR